MCVGAGGDTYILKQTPIWPLHSPMPTPLSADEVRTIASMAKLAPSDEQIESLRTELASMMALSSKLTDADLADVEPMTSPVVSSNRLDDDEPGQTLSAEQVAKLAPDSKDGSIRVPKVLDND
jgi:aspartyl-tRNA(Asn)/glutamyl-tRNA(Gln) amidotransferase subunit C